MGVFLKPCYNEGNDDVEVGEGGEGDAAGAAASQAGESAGGKRRTRKKFKRMQRRAGMERQGMGVQTRVESKAEEELG